MSNIKKIRAREILDSRGNPTISVDVLLEDGSIGSASVPSGASTGEYEAMELRDKDKRFNGLGVLKAVKNVNIQIDEALKGQNALNQKTIDEILLKLDGTENKSVLGANAILGVSLAVSRAASIFLKIPLYEYLANLYNADGNWQDSLLDKKEFKPVTLYFNIINGGRHADNNIDIQETMIVPKTSSISESVRIASEVYHSLKKVFKERGLSTAVGDEGGFAPNLESNTEAMSLLVEAIGKAGYKAGEEVSIALDVAASEIFRKDDGEKYFLKSQNIALASHQLVGLYADWISEFPVVSIEDGAAEDDWEGWKDLTSKLANKIQLVGDDLFVTNTKRIKKGIEEGVANAVLIKPNQIGSLTETFDAIKLAKEN